MALLDPDRLFPVEDRTRGLSREIYDGIKDLPIISPHGHTDPSWFARDDNFPDPARLFVTPDHYVFRMFCSQGIDLASLGVPRVDGGETEQDPRKIWRVFAENLYLLRGTPSSMWLNHAFQEVFGIETPLSRDTADEIYDHIDACLNTDAFKPRALYDRFNIEALSTTEMALDDLKHHKTIGESDWNGTVISAYRPDNVIDPEFAGFTDNVMQLGALTGENTATWDGYLNAHRARRAYFKDVGRVTSSDHGHPTARTENFSAAVANELFQKALSGTCTADEADAFRGHMLTEMARMSLDDGLTMQIHAGSHRNHSGPVLEQFGRDKGFDIPTKTEFVNNLKPLLNAVGMERDLTVILFMLDETTQSRELAPLAGVYPALRLGPPWWFHDSFEGMKRFRENTTETAGFYNTVGFNDDTRAFCSIPARHDVARRVDAGYLATLVATGRLSRNEAHEVAQDLTYNLVKKAYRL
ncbi:glucuronate isomerase [Pacificibacter marinus]|uniref:glucuronate isomerase n=1 Tax=Pacificibacter marinus TaxID=658057 RepID=UPI001C07B363|nr:glucuronate isomerase [Pacificibacter marinus]MBU2865413.1 glucuronate isomerase [Pacificibacter marinus]